MCTAGSVFVGPHSGQCCVRIVAGLDATGHIKCLFSEAGFGSKVLPAVIVRSPAFGHGRQCCRSRSPAFGL
jgi:hypothetical protein